MTDQLEWEFKPNEPQDELVEKIACLIEKDEKACRWPKFLRNLLDVFKHQISLNSKLTGDALAIRLVLAMSNYLGGRSFYLARGDELQDEIRDQEIYKLWHQAPDDATRFEVVEKAIQELGCTDRNVLRLLAKQKLKRRPKQTALELEGAK